MAQEKRFTGKDHDIITKAAARGHQAAQLHCAIAGWVLTTCALEDCFVSGKAAQVERVHRFGLRLFNLERGLAIGALSLRGAKGQERPLRE